MLSLRDLQRRGRRGFTVFELVVVFVVIGILTFIISVTYRQTLNLAHESSAKGSATTIAQYANALSMYRTDGTNLADISDAVSEMRDPDGSGTAFVLEMISGGAKVTTSRGDVGRSWYVCLDSGQAVAVETAC